MRCVSVSEASEILAGCKRLEKENLRWVHWELQNRFSTMRLDSTLSAAAQPFQPRPLHSHHERMMCPEPTPLDMDWHGLVLLWVLLLTHLWEGHPPATTNPQTMTGYPLILPSQIGPSAGGVGAEEVEVAGVVVTPMELTPLGGRHKKKDGFSSKIQIPKFGAKKGHPHDVADTFRQWARCITYYRDYYEDSYLMPLVVSSLMGDASNVFDWILSLNPGNTQDLTTLLQMLREHYCGSLTFREQRNTIKNLHQRPQEATIDFLMRVGTSVSNLGKDWKDKLTDKELQSLQYEVSLNGVQEEIRHVLDSEIAKNGGKLTPQQMYEAVKRYETYVAHNKRLEGKGTSSSASQQKATGHTSGYKLWFHKTTAFAATIP